VVCEKQVCKQQCAGGGGELKSSVEVGESKECVSNRTSKVLLFLIKTEKKKRTRTLGKSPGGADNRYGGKYC